MNRSDPQFPTMRDIEEMKRNGYDRTTIDEAVAAYERRAAQEPLIAALCEKISRAFSGVRLGDGLGLREAASMDDHADGETRKQLRAFDEKENWTRLTVEDLNQFDGLFYLDAAGLRFYLPALMIAELKGGYVHGLAQRLARSVAADRFRLLNADQLKAVREVLVLMRDGSEDPDERMHLDRALRDQWPDADAQ